MLGAELLQRGLPAHSALPCLPGTCWAGLLLGNQGIHELALLLQLPCCDGAHRSSCAPAHLRQHRPLLLCLEPAEEPKRYAALVAHLAAQWQRDKAGLGVAAAAEATLPFVPLAKT